MELVSAKVEFINVCPCFKIFEFLLDLLLQSLFLRLPRGLKADELLQNLKDVASTMRERERELNKHQNEVTRVKVELIKLGWDLFHLEQALTSLATQVNRFLFFSFFLLGSIH